MAIAHGTYVARGERLVAEALASVYIQQFNALLGSSPSSFTSRFLLFTFSALSTSL